MWQMLGDFFHALTSRVTVPVALAVGVPVVLGGLVGSICFEDQATWYRTLKRPFWEPPPPVFGQVWGFLYVLIGYASYLVWQTPDSPFRRHALKLYLVNLALNLAWQPIFFKFKKLGLAQFENLLVLGTAFATMGAFYKVEHFAGSLLLPYVIWLVFANLLNYSVWKNNPNATSIIEPLRDSAPNPGEGGYEGSNVSASLRTMKASGRDRKPLRVFAAAPVMASAKPRMPSHSRLAVTPLVKPAGLMSSRSIRADAATYRPTAIMLA